MSINFSSRRTIILWQLFFILLSTTWLWAPSLNHLLSSRTALISQYEVPLEPYSWVFRIGDGLGALVLVLAARTIIKRPGQKLAGWLLLVVGAGMFIDPAIPTTCHITNGVCKEYFSTSFLAHSVESVITAGTILALGVYDFWRCRSVVSTSFLVFQIGYLGLFLSQLATKNDFNTISQFLYQTISVIWIAWFCQSTLSPGHAYKPNRREALLIRRAVATWAFVNGLLAILVSLAHLHLLGKLKGLYFAGDSAWLAQHGVIIGVVMLYLSRHLARGELRARQIFLFILGVECLKYSVVTPNPALLILYLTSFCALFVLRDDFDVGTVPLSIKVRLKDLVFMLSALLMAVVVAALALFRNSHTSNITKRSIKHFFDYTARSTFVPHAHIKSALLAHTLSAFALVSALVVAITLFRPRLAGQLGTADPTNITRLLEDYSTTAEDFFKLWPNDKEYYWSQQKNGFVAYKIVGSVAFALADPVAGPGMVKPLADGFVSWCRSQSLRTCFLPVYSKSLPIYKKIGLSDLEIGASAVVNIDKFLLFTANEKWWRWQKNRAAKRAYQYRVSQPPHSPRLLSRLQTVSDSWLAKAGRQERSFALGYFDRGYMQKCVVHYLTDSFGRVLAFTNQVPAFKNFQTVTIDLLRYLPEDSGPMPYLLFKIIEQFAGQSGYKYFDMGFVPFVVSQKPVVKLAKTISTGRFSSRGLEQFKNKFRPTWQPNYLAYDGDLGDLALIAVNLEKLMKPPIHQK